jgi:hypothetical protein
VLRWTAQAAFADYFSSPASVKFTLSPTKKRGRNEIEHCGNGIVEAF